MSKETLHAHTHTDIERIIQVWVIRWESGDGGKCGWDGDGEGGNGGGGIANEK